MSLWKPDLPLFTGVSNKVSLVSNNIPHCGKIRVPAYLTGSQTKVNPALTGGRPYLQKYDTYFSIHSVCAHDTALSEAAICPNSKLTSISRTTASLSCSTKVMNVDIARLWIVKNQEKDQYTT